MTIHSKEELARRVSEAVAAVSPRIVRKDEDDFDVRIKYEAMTKRQMTALEAGPGRVHELAEQQDIHLLPPLTFEAVLLTSSDEQFAINYGNFFARFYPEGIGDTLRKHAYMQRLRILFPELEEVAMLLVADRSQRHLKGDLSDYPFYARFMRLVYAVLCQLVDVNDMYAGQRVGESKNRRVMLTV